MARAGEADGGKSMRRRRILLVDDEVSITRAISLYLTQHGDCDVRVENEATRALATAQEFLPDLIFLDIVMPHLDGGALAAQIQSDPVLRGTPLVFLTALVSLKETGGASKQIGGYPFLAKPVHLETVLAYVDAHARAR